VNTTPEKKLENLRNWIYWQKIEAIAKLWCGRHNTQYNSTQHNDIQFKSMIDTQHNETQHESIQDNNTKHNITRHKHSQLNSISDTLRCIMSLNIETIS